MSDKVQSAGRAAFILEAPARRSLGKHGCRGFRHWGVPQNRRNSRNSMDDLPAWVKDTAFDCMLTWFGLDRAPIRGEIEGLGRLRKSPGTEGG